MWGVEGEYHVFDLGHYGVDFCSLYVIYVLVGVALLVISL